MHPPTWVVYCPDIRQTTVPLLFFLRERARVRARDRDRELARRGIESYHDGAS